MNRTLKKNIYFLPKAKRDYSLDCSIFLLTFQAYVCHILHNSLIMIIHKNHGLSRKNITSTCKTRV